MERYVLKFYNHDTNARTILEPYTARKTAVERCDAWRACFERNKRNISVNVLDRKTNTIIY